METSVGKLGSCRNAQIDWNNNGTGTGTTAAHHALPFDELVVYEDCDIWHPKKLLKCSNDTLHY